MRLSRHFSTSSFLILLNSSITVKSFSYKYKYDVENFQPIEYVDFNLLSGDQVDVSRNKYHLYNEDDEPSTEHLPLLSRGERETDTDDDDWDDNVKVPSCSELKKMWKIARRIHNRAIKTNEVPQKSFHPFSGFESDRFRTAQRLKNKSKYKIKSLNGADRYSTSGSKEVSDNNFGIIRYAPSDTVKRPGSGEKVYDVLRKMNPGVKYSSVKDPGDWATGVMEFEPEAVNIRPFDTLRNKLREEKKLPPMPEKSVSQRQDIWGKVLTHYKNKGNVKSNLDTLKEQLLSDSRRSSRLNYRDETSAPIQTSYSRGDTTFGQHWNSRKSLRKHRKSKNKKRKKGRKKKFRGSKNYDLKNFFMKGQV